MIQESFHGSLCAVGVIKNSTFAVLPPLVTLRWFRLPGAAWSGSDLVWQFMSGLEALFFLEQKRKAIWRVMAAAGLSA